MSCREPRKSISGICARHAVGGEGLSVLELCLQGEFSRGNLNTLSPAAGPDLLPQDGVAGVAQLVEHLICNQRVGGSNPFASSKVRGGGATLRFALHSEATSKVRKYVGGSARARELASVKIRTGGRAVNGSRL